MNKKTLFLFFTLFYIVWTIKELVFHPSSTEVNQYILSFFIKLVIWIGSVGFYLLYIDRFSIQKSLDYLKFKENTYRGIIVGITAGVILIAIELFIYQKLSLDIGIRWVTTPIIAFSEEVVFRGFLMNQLQDIGVRRYNLVQSIVFTGIHLPIGIIQGYPLINYLVISIVGYLLGLIYKKTNSIWSSTIVHSIYNLLIYVRK